MLVNNKTQASNLISITCQESRNPPGHTVTSALGVINHQLPYICRITEKKTSWRNLQSSSSLTSHSRERQPGSWIKWSRALPSWMLKISKDNVSSPLGKLLQYCTIPLLRGIFSLCLCGFSFAVLFLLSALMRRIWLHLSCNTPLVSGRLQLNSSLASFSPGEQALPAYLYIWGFHTPTILIPRAPTKIFVNPVLWGSQNKDSTPDANS